VSGYASGQDSAVDARDGVGYQRINDKNDWAEDGSQPFVWSTADKTGFSTHADYLFGWKGDSLQKAMDGHTYVSAPMLKTQSIAEQNKCTVKDMVGENFDGCKFVLPHLDKLRMLINSFTGLDKLPGDNMVM
jgi:hypothetical protein